MPPWTRSGRRPADALFLRETVPGSELHTSVLSPFAITGPDWLLNRTRSPPSGPGKAPGKLLFFAGNIPKLYLSRTRYTLWRALRNDARVTALSSTLRCTVGAYSVCRRGEAAIMGEGERFFRSWCKPFCGEAAPCGWSGDTLDASRRRLARTCRGFPRIDDAEFADMARDTRSLTRAQFLAETLTHSFCLVTPGDWNAASPKIAEAIAVGGVGGCVPVLVVPSLEPRQLSAFLPYTRWLDYCAIAVMVSVREVTAPGGPLRLLRHLEAIPDSELAAKRRALAGVGDAFVTGRRRGEANNSGDAVSYVAAEICALAKSRAQGQGGGAGSNGTAPLLPPWIAQPIHDVQRCAALAPLRDHEH